MAIDLESRTLQGLNAFIGLLLLNLLHLLCCLPLLTIGAATSALLETLGRFADEERGHLLRDYLRALIANFLPATALHLVLGLPVAALGFAALFWIRLDGLFSLVAAGLTGLGALYLLAAWIHAQGLVAAFRAPLRRTLRNALLLPGAEPLRTAGLVAVPAALLAAALVVPGAPWLLLTLGASLGGYASVLLLRAIHRRAGTPD